VLYYQDQFSNEHDVHTAGKPSKVLIIASNARSGSHMLGHALHKTECFGFPLEYTNPANFKEWQRLLKQESLADVIKALQTRRTSENGVFSIKVHYSHLALYGGFKGLMSLFPDAYYVLLSRKDVLKQAISLSIAAQTGVWITGQKPTSDDPKYDYPAIKHFLKSTILDQASWRYTLAANGANFIEMNFDAIKSDIPASVAQVGAFMNIAVPLDKIPLAPVTKPQSNELNAQWLQRFLQDYEDGPLVKPDRYALFKEWIKKALKK
jgi:LPS sulfotransferase NodH